MSRRNCNDCLMTCRSQTRKDVAESAGNLAPDEVSSDDSQGLMSFPCAAPDPEALARRRHCGRKLTGAWHLLRAQIFGQLQ